MNSVKVGKIAILALLFFGVSSAIVMLLWNWLLPGLFGLHSITYWQALGLFILSRILFGRLGSGGFRRHWHHRNWKERWAGMTPGERERRCDRHAAESETTGTT